MARICNYKYVNELTDMENRKFSPGDFLPINEEKTAKKTGKYLLAYFD